MKIILIIVFFLIGQYAHAMGDPHFLPGNPLSPNEIQHVNDIEETTAGINQLSKDRGHEDQQKMEEKELKQEKGLEIKKEKEKVFKEDEQKPIKKTRINHG